MTLGFLPTQKLQDLETYHSTKMRPNFVYFSKIVDAKCHSGLAITMQKVKFESLQLLTGRPLWFVEIHVLLQGYMQFVQVNGII